MLDGTIQEGFGPLKRPPRSGLWPVEVIVQVISTCPTAISKWIDWESHHKWIWYIIMIVIEASRSLDP